MKSIKKMTSIELAAFIQDHLKAKDIDVILSGGACVTFYSNNKYVSMDLDLINISFTKRHDIREAMKEIGFTEEARYFIHPETKFFVEFPPGPLAVGEEPVRKIDEVKQSTGLLRIISSTDCVKDRLAGYYHWKDLQCLEQAVLVAAHAEIDLKEVENWSKKEGMEDKFEYFKAKLSNKK
ncbi:MAG: hypothetical protein R6V04_12530 [bacterium]